MQKFESTFGYILKLADSTMYLMTIAGLLPNNYFQHPQSVQDVQNAWTLIRRPPRELVKLNAREFDLCRNCFLIEICFGHRKSERDRVDLPDARGIWWRQNATNSSYRYACSVYACVACDRYTVASAERKSVFEEGVCYRLLDHVSQGNNHRKYKVEAVRNLSRPQKKNCALSHYY